MTILWGLALWALAATVAATVLARVIHVRDSLPLSMVHAQRAGRRRTGTRHPEPLWLGRDRLAPEWTGTASREAQVFSRPPAIPALGDVPQVAPAAQPLTDGAPSAVPAPRSHGSSSPSGAGAPLPPTSVTPTSATPTSATPTSTPPLPR